MQQIIKQIKSYCSGNGAGRTKIYYFLLWFYVKNKKQMDELASRLGVLHNPTAYSVSHEILDNAIRYQLIKPQKIVINGKECQIFKYEEETTREVRQYKKIEKNWIRIIKDEF